MIYYGDEVGMSGGPDPGCRKAMVWDPEEQDRDLLCFYSTLIKIRKGSSALTKGSFIPLVADDENKIYSYARKFNDQICIIVLNLNSKDYECDIPIRNLELLQGTIFRDVLTSRTCTLRDDKISIPVIEGNFGGVLVPIHDTM